MLWLNITKLKQLPSSEDKTESSCHREADWSDQIKKGVEDVLVSQHVQAY